MKSNQLQRVNYAQAVKLAAHGFDFDEGYSYSLGESDEIRFCACNKRISADPLYVLAPTVALALQYVREVLDVPCAVEMLFRADTGGVSYQGRYVWAGKGEIRTQTFGRHPDAASKLLDMILNDL